MSIRTACVDLAGSIGVIATVACAAPAAASAVTSPARPRTVVEAFAGPPPSMVVISPARVLIGKNVRVEGTLGARYGVVAGELDGTTPHPFIMRGDFAGLDVGLDIVLDLLRDRITVYDIDGDNRIDVDDPVESLGLLGAPELIDADDDGAVDDFDLFIVHYDGNGDRRVVYDDVLATAAGLGNLEEEFADVDDQLAHLIDAWRPDRNGDGVVDMNDTLLGYLDGVLDQKDGYAKVDGTLAVGIGRATWETALAASYQTVVQGPIRPPVGAADAVRFGVGLNDLPEIVTLSARLDPDRTWFADVARTGVPFGKSDGNAWTGQVGAEIARGGTYSPPDDWESYPFESSGAFDYFRRPIFRDMTFTNVRIPVGNNGLFENCTFVGVTFIDTDPECTNPNWNYAGAVEPVDHGGFITYELRFPDLPNQTEIDAGTIVADTRVRSNSLRFHDCTFLGAVSGRRPKEYTEWRNAVAFTGNTRVYTDPTDPDLAAQADAATLEQLLLTIDPDMRADLARSSIFLPGWPVTIRNEPIGGIAPADMPKTKLTGAIVAATLEARGTIDVFGFVLLTFRPIEGEGPLFYGGHPQYFRSRIGFTPEDDDRAGADPDGPAFRGFGEITLRRDPAATLPSFRSRSRQPAE